MTMEYICDCCKRHFQSEEAAMACEDSHMRPASVIGTSWAIDTRYPEKIRVSFPDGKTRVYVTVEKEGAPDRTQAGFRKSATWQQPGYSYGFCAVIKNSP